MKKLLLIIPCVLLWTIPSFASFLEIENLSFRPDVSLGEYRGRKFPSLCEDGFCFEEINVKYRPFSGFENIQGNVRLDTTRLDRSMFLFLGDEFFEIMTSCDGFDDQITLGIQKIQGRMTLSELKKRTLCMKSSSTIVID